MTKVTPSNGNKTNLTFFHWTDSALTSYLFLSRNKLFHWLLKSKFLSFMTKVTPSNGNKTNLTFFHWTDSALTSYLFLSRNKLFHWLLKSKFLSFMTTWDTFKSDINFYWSQNTKININGNKTKLDIFFMRHIQIWYHFLLVSKY